MARRSGFTLIELLVTILIIFALMGLIIGGIRHIGKRAKGAADAATAHALDQGVTQFKQTFGFLPPLIKDGFDTTIPTGGAGPLVTSGAEKRPSVFTSQDVGYLRIAPAGPVVNPPQAALYDGRFSICSLPFYVLGVVDVQRSMADPTPVDGVSGPGFRAVKRDGTFEHGGKTYSPFFDVSKNAKAVFEPVPGSGVVILQDSRGVAFRYYRWRHNDPVTDIASLNIPWMVGDQFNPDPEVRNADYAIVAAGPDGLFGDEWLLPSAAGPNGQHPQYMNQGAFDGKLGGRAPAPGVPGDVERTLRAKADNIVIVGTER